MTRWAWIAMGLTGCTPEVPEDSLQFAEHWELLGVMGDGAVVDARVTVGNTGVLRGQGRVQIDLWPREGEPIRYSRWSAPEATRRSADGRSVVLDTDQLRSSGDLLDSWHLRARSDEANAVLQVQGRGPAVAPQTFLSRGSWTIDAPVPVGTMQGWFESGDRGGKLDGWGVVLHRLQDGGLLLAQQSVFVMSDDLFLGVDLHGPDFTPDTDGPIRQAFGMLNGRSLNMRTATITCEDGVVGLDLRPEEELVLRLVPTTAWGKTDRTEHWTPPERWVAGALTRYLDRTVAGAQVEVVVGDLPAASRRGLVVWTDAARVDLPTKGAERPQGRRRVR